MIFRFDFTNFFFVELKRNCSQDKSTQSVPFVSRLLYLLFFVFAGRDFLFRRKDLRIKNTRIKRGRFCVSSFSETSKTAATFATLLLFSRQSRRHGEKILAGLFRNRAEKYLHLCLGLVVRLFPFLFMSGESIHFCPHRVLELARPNPETRKNY